MIILKLEIICDERLLLQVIKLEAYIPTKKSDSDLEDIGAISVVIYKYDHSFCISVPSVTGGRFLLK